MVHTEEFSLVRLRGDQAAADKVYAGVAAPLTADDIADCIAFAVTRPPHVNIDLLVVKPLAQAAPHKVDRRPALELDADQVRLGAQADAEAVDSTPSRMTAGEIQQFAPWSRRRGWSAPACASSTPTPSGAAVEPETLAEAGVLDQPGGRQLGCRRAPASSGSRPAPRRGRRSG